jgi:hypothetical protein
LLEKLSLSLKFSSNCTPAQSSCYWKALSPMRLSKDTESWQTKCYSSLITEKHPMDRMSFAKNPVISNQAKAGTWSIIRNNLIMNWTLWIMSQTAR